MLGILDLDGTVFDTEYGVSAITADLATQAGLPVSADAVFQTIAGLGSREKFQAIAAGHGRVLDDETLKNLSRAHQQKKATLYDAPDLKLISGAERLIHTLYNEGVMLCAATNNKRETSLKGLQRMGLTDYFQERVYTPEQVGGLKKPDPAMLYRILEEHKTPASQAFGVEDSLAGVQAFNAAGIRVYAYTDPRLGHALTARARAMQVEGAMVIEDYSLIPGLEEARRNGRFAAPNP